MLTGATVQATAPWWGVPTVAGCFLIIGGMLSFLSTYFSDKRKAKQDVDRMMQAEQAQRRKDMQVAAASFLVETRGVYEAFKSNFVAD